MPLLPPDFPASNKMSVKRIFDLTGVILSTPLWLPVLALVSLGVAWKMGRPVFFKQKRPGRNGEVFELIKFRTMRNAVDSAGNPLPDSERLTAFGRWLRASSLDELPELINVLRGEMSLVGPRPLLVSYLPLYSPEQSRRHEVLPGITGWAQVNGRNALSWEEKFQHDVWYVDHHDLILDVKILFLTFKKVFFREGISAPGDATMPEFKGNHHPQVKHID